MSKDDAAWLLVRFVGVLCVVLALVQLVGISYWVNNVLETYDQFNDRDIPRRMALAQYRGAWLFVIEDLVRIAATSLLAWYCLAKGSRFHTAIMRGGPSSRETHNSARPNEPSSE